ncbi:MAG: co-chaperone GroES [Candidatus Marinimicrobia bacterium]|nr:co-chaperone GroES [Candidatus Neomarinimicrobiota bacterium]
MKELQPVNEYVLLDYSDEEKDKKNAFGDHYSETAKEKKTSAKVLGISNIENAEVKVGDTVLFKEYSGNELVFEGKKYLLIPYADILAKIVETESV